MLKTVGNPSTRYGDQSIIDGNLVLMPNSDLSNENPEVVEVANQVFTDEVKTSYQIHVQSLKDH